MTRTTFYEFQVDVHMHVYGPDWEGDDALYRDIAERVTDAGIRVEDSDMCCEMCSGRTFFGAVCVRCYAGARTCCM